jgi:hypothetical protein
MDFASAAYDGSPHNQHTTQMKSENGSFQRMRVKVKYLVICHLL